MLNTIAVRSTKRSEGWVLINEDDFDPLVHVLFDFNALAPRAPKVAKAEVPVAPAPEAPVAEAPEAPVTQERVPEDFSRTEFSLPRATSFDRRPVGRPKKKE